MKPEIMAGPAAPVKSDGGPVATELDGLVAAFQDGARLSDMLETAETDARREEIFDAWKRARFAPAA